LLAKLWEKLIETELWVLVPGQMMLVSWRRGKGSNQAFDSPSKGIPTILAIAFMGWWFGRTTTRLILTGACIGTQLVSGIPRAAVGRAL
jgi:hypothetical protein